MNNSSEKASAGHGPRQFTAIIDEVRHSFQGPLHKGSELFDRAGKAPCRYAFVQIIKGEADQFIDPDEEVDLSAPGVERFDTVLKDDVIIMIDETAVTLRRATVSVAEIKRLGGIADGYQLAQDVAGVLKPLPDDGSVSIEGCEVFESRPPAGGAS